MLKFRQKVMRETKFFCFDKKTTVFMKYLVKVKLGTALCCTNTCCPKMFCASPNFLSYPNDLTAFSAGTKNNFTECKPSYCLAQNVCDWHYM